jgi:Na+/H+ antiporter NhaD/arsenite permease-like protein
MDVLVAGGIFIAAYILIATERFDRTLVALLGGLLLVALGIVDQGAAFAAIDLNVIFLLAGMMIMAGVLASTGFFEWVAIQAVAIAHGRPVRLLLLLTTITALLSAFLDNVTTVVLLAPVVLSVSRRLGVDPKPLLIGLILASNVGGTATLIGDPPNLLVGSAAGLDFTAFLVNLGPVTLVIFAALQVFLWLAFRDGLKAPTPTLERAVEADRSHAIEDPRRLAITLIVIGATMVGFLLHTALHLEAATVALLGATVLLLLTRADPHEALRDVEWVTLLFFVGLYILVEAVVEVGIVGSVGDAVVEASGGDVVFASIALLWVSALGSAIVDNIPYTATAIPVVQRLVDDGVRAEPLWWSLALGACLGGNLTVVGASANIVVANLALRAGHRIAFFEFMRYGAVAVGLSLLISSAYVWMRYLT